VLTATAERAPTDTVSALITEIQSKIVPLMEDAQVALHTLTALAVGLQNLLAQLQERETGQGRWAMTGGTRTGQWTNRLSSPQVCRKQSPRGGRPLSGWVEPARQNTQNQRHIVFDIVFTHLNGDVVSVQP
jgi:hypothetical protein